MVTDDFDPEVTRPVSVANTPRGDVPVNLRGRPSDKSKTGGWKAAHFMLVMVFMETVATLSLGINLITYFVSVEHFQIADAANAATSWIGTEFFLTVLGGFIADAFLGRYWTTVSSSLILIVGFALLITTAAVRRPPACLTLDSCEAAGAKYLGPLYTGLYLIALGSGGVKPNVNALGADQFDDSDPKEQKLGRTYFNISFLYGQLGACVGITFMIYMQNHVSFQAAYGTAMSLYIVAFLAFIFGTPYYRHKVSAGSPLTRIAQVFVAAIRKWRVPIPADPAELLEVTGSDESVIKGSRKLAHTSKFRFLDKAAVVTKPHEKANPWRIVTVTQVEELKRVLLMLPIWFSTALTSLIFAQFTSLTVQQGSTLDLHLGPNFVVPPASLGFISFFSASVLVIPYVLLVPYARKLTGHRLGISPLQRIGAGFIFGSLTMVIAALVERKRLSYVRAQGLEHQVLGTFVINNMKIYWVVPQNVCLAVTEIFVYVGQMEFFYGEAPDGLRSLAISLTHSAQALGFLLSSALVNSVNHYTRNTPYGAWLKVRLNNGGLERFFWLLAIITLVDYVVFLILCYFYEYKQLTKGAAESDSPMSQIEREDTLKVEPTK